MRPYGYAEYGAASQSRPLDDATLCKLARRGGFGSVLVPRSIAHLVTSTIDPTLAAAFNIQPTSTRMPTFTAPPPLTVTKFEDESSPLSSGVFGVFIIGLGLLGSVGLLVSFLLRK